MFFLLGTCGQVELVERGDFFPIDYVLSVEDLVLVPGEEAVAALDVVGGVEVARSI